jgi:hypothetical protein
LFHRLAAGKQWADSAGSAEKTSVEVVMAKLVTSSRFPNPDAAYVTLVEARRDLSDAAAAAFDARLVLILANHIGDLDVLREAIVLAREAAR